MVTGYAGAIPMLVDRSRVFWNCNPQFAVVIHKTAGFSTIEELGHYFATTPDVTSSHYGVGLDGRIAQFVDEIDGSAANCCLTPGHDPFWDTAPDTSNLNYCTITIEHIDPSSDNSTPPTPAQLAASFALVLDICTRHNIPVSNIKTHASIDPVNRSRCPNNYPMDALVWHVKSGGTPPQGNNTVDMTIKQVTPSPGQAQQALDVWNANKAIAVIPHSGIFQAWALLLYNGKGIGMPVSGEYVAHDWNMNAIIRQDFAGGHIEWTGTARAFAGPLGEFKFI